jgi:hypothetical protein
MFAPPASHPRPRHTLLVVVALAGLIGTGALRAHPVLADGASLPSRDELQASLRTSCEVRMRQLKQQGQEHLAAVKWQQGDAGVRGEYVDYSPDYVCGVSPAAGETPAGRMQYQEIHFEKRGADVAAAMEAAPQPLRIEEVTQVFVYRRGIWE